MYASAVLTFLEYIFCVLNVYITEIFQSMTQAQKKPGFGFKNKLLSSK